MAWTYSNWTQQTDAETRLAYLRLHMTEVSDKIDKELTVAGHMSSSRSLQEYYNSLIKAEGKLAAAATSSNAGRARVSVPKFRDMR